MMYVEYSVGCDHRPPNEDGTPPRGIYERTCPLRAPRKASRREAILAAVEAGYRRIPTTWGFLCPNHREARQQ